MMELDKNKKSVPVNNRKQRLTDPHRVEAITKHRAWEGQTLQEKHNPRHTVISATLAPRV